MSLVLDPKFKSQMDWALRFLTQDQVVALPTETVYGLAGRVFSDLALSRIFSLKARPHFDPLIAHVTGLDMAKELALEFDEVAKELIKNFWPGPLTILCKKSKNVSDLCTGGSDEVAIRQPSHKVFAEILKRLGEPLAAPSANRFKGISPTSYEHVLEELGPFGLPAVVDGGPCVHGVESTVVRVRSSQKLIEILRPGACQVEELRNFSNKLGFEIREAISVLDSKTKHHAPGQLAKHYSPSKPVVFFEFPWESFTFKSIQENDLSLFVTADDYKLSADKGFSGKEVVVLGKTKTQSAANLFSELRKFDQNKKYSRLIAFGTSTEGLGLAINDRLKRAAGSEIHPS